MLILKSPSEGMKRWDFGDEEFISTKPLMNGIGVFIKEAYKFGCHLQQTCSHTAHALWKQYLTRHRGLGLPPTPAL